VSDIAAFLSIKNMAEVLRLDKGASIRIQDMEVVLRIESTVHYEWRTWQDGEQMAEQRTKADV
jgi:hypothetical protein